MHPLRLRVLQFNPVYSYTIYSLILQHHLETIAEDLSEERIKAFLNVYAIVEDMRQARNLMVQVWYSMVWYPSFSSNSKAKVLILPILW